MDLYTIVVFWLMSFFCWNLVFPECQNADKVRTEIIQNRGTYYIGIVVWITSH